MDMVLKKRERASLDQIEFEHMYAMGFDRIWWAKNRGIYFSWGHAWIVVKQAVTLLFFLIWGTRSWLTYWQLQDNGLQNLVLIE